MNNWKEPVIGSIEQAKNQLDDALRQLDEMKAVESTTVGVAAHALNNFLSVTVGTLQLISADLKDTAAPQVKMWLSSLLHASDMMTSIVHKLMNASVHSEVSLIQEEFDLATMARRVCEHYQRVAKPKGIRLSFEGGQAGTVMADRVAAAAVLDNLMSNAVKYTPREGEIEVSVEVDGEWIACSVQDTGPGISAEDQLKLFKPGARLSSRPSAGEPSHGYGLAVAYELTSKLGGALTCISELGKGSRFELKLPAPRKQ